MRPNFTTSIFEWKCDARPYIPISMLLTVNGKKQELSPATTTAADLLSVLNIQRERVAVVLNENVVRRAELENTTLADGDTVEIITMVGGG